MLLVIDNYDSFTYNLVQYLGELGAEMKIFRNDEITLEEIENEIKPDKILISPGPGTPDDAGVSLDILKKLGEQLPILGVCLGHQAIGQIFGGKVVRAPEPVHGKPVEICHDGKTIFKDLTYRFRAGRYHSLIVERESLPDCLEISATSPDGLIMGLRHKQFKIEGVQFHPESILTLEGKNSCKTSLKFEIVEVTKDYSFKQPAKTDFIRLLLFVLHLSPVPALKYAYVKNRMASFRADVRDEQ